MTKAGKHLNDPLANLPGYLLRRASAAALTELNERLAPFGVRHADVSLLLLIGANPGITQSQAGRVLDIQRANMVPLIARLEKRKLIERTPVDGRSQALRLVPAGRALLAKAHAEVQAHETGLLERVPEDLRPHVRPILLALWQRPAT
jgi:DNA-binding MarR family transcriptional regulator